RASSARANRISQPREKINVALTESYGPACSRRRGRNSDQIPTRRYSRIFAPRLQSRCKIDILAPESNDWNIASSLRLTKFFVISPLLIVLWKKSLARANAANTSWLISGCMKFVFGASLRQPELSYATSRFSGRHTRRAASADAAAVCDNAALRRVAAFYSQT